jgi:SAM-dependent methyltransferase
VEVKPPAAPVLQAASLVAPGRALDIACGSGRHAIWLHEHGWEVTALDRDIEAIQRIQRCYPAIDARIVDLEENPLAIEPGRYDLAVCWLYHQRELYPRIREAVRPGGSAALCALLQGRFAAAPGELRSYFPGWRIVHEAETDHGPTKRASELVVQSIHSGNMK